MRKKFLEQDVDMPPDECPDRFWQLAYERGEVKPRVLSTVDCFEGHLLSKCALNAQLLSVVSVSSFSGSPESSLPSVDQSGIFFDLQPSTLSVGLPATLPIRRGTATEEETRNDSFHDSESEDIYDLYNACNGIVREDGLLDARELDEFSQEEAEALNVVRLKEIWEHTAAGCSTCQETVQILNSVRGSFEGHFLSECALTERLLSVASVSSFSGSPESSIPSVDQLGIFFDLQQSTLSTALPATSLLRRRTVAEEETRNDSFHDSESEDIYDLYNACNGIVRDDGLLDIRALDELSPKEAEALNVVRLKEIWEHTAAGCSTCQGIVELLNAVRGTLKANAKDQLVQVEGVDTNVIDSIS